MAIHCTLELMKYGLYILQELFEALQALVQVAPVLVHFVKRNDFRCKLLVNIPLSEELQQMVIELLHRKMRRAIYVGGKH